MASRSLGALLGLGSLAFKLETGQPTGSWLDREAALLVEQALADGFTGLCVVDVAPLAAPLAVQCARAGLRLLILRSGIRDRERASCIAPPGNAAPADGWLAALGARVVTVAADPTELAVAAHGISAGAGLCLVDRASQHHGSGLAAVATEIAEAGLGTSLLAVPALTSDEPTALVTLAERASPAVPLPLDGLDDVTGGSSRPFAAVGCLLRPGQGTLAPLPEGTASCPHVLAVPITPREADAARVLLAREEGLIASLAGAAALAALVRAVREDRARRPRERRFPRDVAAVVVLTGEPLGSGGSPPVAADVVTGRAVSLAELAADPRRLLVEPPGGRPG